jgi:hypothetical protein
MFADMRTAVNGEFGSSSARSTKRFSILNAAVGHNFQPALSRYVDVDEARIKRIEDNTCAGDQCRTHQAGRKGFQ